MSAYIVFFKKCNFITELSSFFWCCSSFSNAGVTAASGWMIFKLLSALSVVSSRLLYNTCSCGRYCFHKDYVSLSWGGYGQDHGETGKPFPTKGSSSSTRAILSTLWLSWKLIRHWEGCTFFPSYWPFFAQSYGILHISTNIFMHTFTRYQWSVLRLCRGIRALPYRFQQSLLPAGSLPLGISHVNKACMSQTSCFYITNPAISTGDLAEHSGTKLPDGGLTDAFMP